MKKILSKVLYLALAIPVFANATSCPTVGNNLIEDAPVFQWTDNGSYYSGTLIMDEVTITLNNGETLTTRAYAQAGNTPTVPGPTIIMAPGNKYVLKFENRLPYEPLSDLHNRFKDPNVTNLHTHGLHTTGDTPGDDATRIFEGRTGGDYVFDMTSDHMGGTFWIHAHHHGSTYLQISSGAFGMLLIDDSADGQIIGVDSNGDPISGDMPANVVNMEEKLLTLGYLDPSVSGTGGDMLVSGSLSPGWNVNGKVEGDLCMPVNTWQHWRLLVAAADVKAKDVTVGDQCEVALMARDGVWRTMVPKDLNDNTMSLTGGSRADIAVRCTGDSTLSVGGTVVANIYAENVGVDSTVHPYAADGISQWPSFRPSYLRDLRDPALALEGTSVTNFESVSMGARTINGNKFDIDVPTFITAADGVQEWSVSGATNHPFHLHVFHFQAQTDCGEYEAGEYYDTIAASCDVRFDLNPQTSTVFDGKTIFHCHLLDHEDQGAMGYMVVQPAPGTIPAPTYPNDTFAEKYELDGTEPPPPPPAGTILDVGSITVSTNNAGKGQKFGVADIVVVDDLGNPVEGAEVSGEFSGDINEIISASPVTDLNGQTSISTTQSAKVRNLTFCVTDIVDTNGVLDPFTGSVCGSL